MLYYLRRDNNVVIFFRDNNGILFFRDNNSVLFCVYSVYTETTMVYYFVFVKEKVGNGVRV